MENKKRKVLIVYPDFVENSAGTKLKGSYSEGIASISAVLKQGGHDVALYHMGGKVSKEEYIRELREQKPDIAAFSAWTSAYKFVKELLLWTKEEGLFTYVGGYHATLCPEEVISTPGVDCLCIGEGEYPTLDLCDRFGDKEALYQTESLWFNTENGTVKNPVRPFIEDLDSLPPPDMGLFDFDNFLSSRIKTAIVMVSRGCIFGCTYCANSQLRAVYPRAAHYARFKSPRRAVGYLQSILDRYPYIGYFNFMDSILNMHKEWFEEFIVLYTEKLKIPFACRLRLDLIDEDIVRKLKDAGCYLIDVGIESGCPDIRKNLLHRPMTDGVIEKSFSYFRKYGISTLTFNMVGMPHETIQKTLLTVKLNARIKPKKMVVSIFYPFPHTKLTTIAKEAGFLPADADYNSEVVCKQPQYPDKQIRFAQHYFKIFVRLYKFAYACPKWLGKPLESFFGWYFCTKAKPHGLLTALHSGCLKMLHGGKRLLMKLSPKTYVKLRDKSVNLKKD
jgi:radical SAM superfamily enzyme YgiQ (UPF0313 family)